MPDPLLIPYRELGFGGTRPDLMLHFDVTIRERHQQFLLAPAIDPA